MTGRSWRLRRVVAHGQEPWKHLQSAFGISAPMARLAWLRGEDTEEALAWRLKPDWNRSLDPFLLAGMAAAVARIRRALQEKERIVIYGDYDVDGVTATALLVRVLEKLGGSPEYFIPNRFNDGYGLHLECIRELRERGKAGLFISVDCGVRSVEEVRASKDLGIEWIITDHHALGQELPPAEAIIHPALGDYPNRVLAGVGVAFKLGQALLDAVPIPKDSDIPFLDGLLKLVALGTIADMVPLRGENALLVKRGLAALRGANGPGLSELLKLARIQGIPKAQDIAFGIAPRINAVGRMGAAEDAVRLLLTRDAEEARALAAEAEAMNGARKEVQDELATRLPKPDGQAFDLVVDEDAHKGVLGIVAARRMRESGRPTGVGTVLDGIAQCSLRAPEGYDLTELLALAQPFLRSGGGHRAAAGITFEAAHLPFVRQALVRGAAVQGAGLGIQELAIDGFLSDGVPDGDDLAALEPFGQGFPEMLVLAAGRLQMPPQTFGQGHRKLRLEGISGDITWFFGASGASAIQVGETLQLAVSPQDHPRWGRSWRLDTLLESGAKP
ncbi:MAG: DHH family phosphoesterase [Holophaga sp.]|nr:DHH family phosphoesterase [Holophaga sp.]